MKENDYDEDEHPIEEWKEHIEQEIDDMINKRRKKISQKRKKDLREFSLEGNYSKYIFTLAPQI